MAARYFILDSFNDKWGDYGNTLIHGHGWIDDDEGACHLKRTGPFIPPMTHPFGALIVTDALRRKLEQSGLTGFSFVPVIKDKIVELNWHEWDRDSPDPEEFPEGCEPENYIDAGDHSSTAADAVGTLWALKVPETAKIERHKGDKICLVLSTTQGLDFVRSADVLYYYVSEPAKKWLEVHVGEWIEFKNALTR